MRDAAEENASGDRIIVLSRENPTEWGITMIRGFRGVLCLGLLLSAGAAWGQPQGNAQQKCINKINKDMIKVQAAQGKLEAGCVKDAVKTGSNAEACISADAKGKVSGKMGKTSSDEMKKCLALIPAPAFAYTSAAIENAAAAQSEKDLYHDVFGSPVDPGLFLCDTSPAQCLCQRQVIDRVDKLFRAMSAYFVKCKNAALAIGKLPAFPLGAASAADIARCVTDATVGLSVQADTKGKVDDAEGQLVTTHSHFCTVGGEFNGGVCTGLSGTNLTDCLEERTKCRFCRMVNAADGLAIDCTTWSGETCP